MFKKYILPFFGWILPIIVAIILFILAEKKREPVYSVVNSPSLIFDKGNASPKIKLLVNDSTSITENVYVTTLVIWNKGKLSINKEDVRKDFIIHCSDSKSQILDNKILDEREFGVSNFILIPIENKIKIEWDHFDPGYGFKVQVIYTGNNNTKLLVSGMAPEAPIKQVILTTKASKINKIAFFFMVAIGLLSIISMWFMFDKNKMKVWQLISYNLLMIAMLAFFFFRYQSSILSIGVPF